LKVELKYSETLQVGLKLSKTLKPPKVPDFLALAESAVAEVGEELEVDKKEE
jgi:hypothetical protein